MTPNGSAHSTKVCFQRYGWIRTEAKLLGDWKSATSVRALKSQRQTMAGCSAACVPKSFPSRTSMRPARLCREMAAPTWFGRAPLHAAAISCCVLPVASAMT
jgi:hypothetical protein